MTTPAAAPMASWTDPVEADDRVGVQAEIAGGQVAEQVGGAGLVRERVDDLLSPLV